MTAGSFLIFLQEPIWQANLVIVARRLFHILEEYAELNTVPLVPLMLSHKTTLLIVTWTRCGRSFTRTKFAFLALHISLPVQFTYLAELLYMAVIVSQAFPYPSTAAMMTLLTVALVNCLYTGTIKRSHHLNIVVRIAIWEQNVHSGLSSDVWQFLHYDSKFHIGDFCS